MDKRWTNVFSFSFFLWTDADFCFYGFVVCVWTVERVDGHNKIIESLSPVSMWTNDRNSYINIIDQMVEPHTYRRSPAILWNFQFKDEFFFGTFSNWTHLLHRAPSLCQANCAWVLMNVWWWVWREASSKWIFAQNLNASLRHRRGIFTSHCSIHFDVAKAIEIQVLFYYYLYSDARVVTFSCGNSITYAKWHGVNAFS